MKKLLFASMLCLFTAMVSGQVIGTSSPYCCSDGITVVANYLTRPPAVSHYWAIAPSDGSGNPTGLPYYSGSYTGGYGSYTFPSTVASTLCGSFALVTLYVEKSGTPNYWITFTTVIFVNPIPSISGSTTICGTGTFCISNYDLPDASYTLNWQACVGTTTQWTSTDQSGCVTVPANSFNNLILTMTDHNGCQTNVSTAITNSYIDPTFSIVTSGSVDGTHFYVGFQRPAAAGASQDAFTVQEVSSSYPYTAVSGSTWTNPGWASTPNWYTIIYAYNYDGDYNPPYNSPYNFPHGHYKNSSTYRIIRTIDNSGCISTYSIVFNQSGVVCTNCRTSENETTSVEQTNANTFDVFPNPSNGAFQINLSTPVENATAELINMLGERVDAFTFSGSTYSYSPTETLAHGVYMLRINNNGTIYSKRIVIE